MSCGPAIAPFTTMASLLFGSVRAHFLGEKSIHLHARVLAQLVAFVTFASLPATIVAFIDNAAGQATLTTGYGKDTAVNGMISATPSRRSCPWPGMACRV